MFYYLKCNKLSFLNQQGCRQFFLDLKGAANQKRLKITAPDTPSHALGFFSHVECLVEARKKCHFKFKVISKLLDKVLEKKTAELMMVMLAMCVFVGSPTGFTQKSS